MADMPKIRKLMTPISVALCAGSLSLGLLVVVSAAAYMAVFNDFRPTDGAVVALKFAYVTLPLSAIGLIGFFAGLVLNWDDL